MIAYKGFGPGLVCRGYQFVMGLNQTEKADCRQNGFHCAEDPLDCLTYYSNIRHVAKDRAEASAGYAVVRGTDPAARGSAGDILAFAKEDPVSGRILQIALAQVDGRKIFPNVWYGADLTERQVA